jgi:hypothetical protein
MKKGDIGKAIKNPLPINAFVYPVKSYKKSKFLSSLNLVKFHGFHNDFSAKSPKIWSNLPNSMPVSDQNNHSTLNLDTSANRASMEALFVLLISET